MSAVSKLPKGPRPSRLQKKEWKAAYLFICPFFALYLVFGIFPILYSFYLSLCDWKGGVTTFTGFDNYIRLFSDPVFWQATWNTIYIFLINVPIMTLLALIFGAMFNSKKLRFRKGFQLIFLLPYVTSSVAVSMVFLILFDDSTGWINQLLINTGLSPISWLRSEAWSKLTICIMITWQWVGYNMLIMLGGLQNISPELYEAARIDGSGSVKNFFYITLPLMKPVVLFSAIMSTIGTFNMFVEPKILTQGGPGYSSTTITMHLYNQTFQYFQLGYGASIAFVIFLFIMILSIPQIRSAIKPNT